MKAWMKRPKEPSALESSAKKSLAASGKSQTQSRGKGFGLFGKSLPRKGKPLEDDKSAASGGDTLKADERKLEMEALHLCYEEYIKQEENMSGLLNTKTLNLKNMDLRDKLKFWRESKDLRERQIEKLNEKEKQLLDVLIRYSQELSVEKDKVETCKSDYYELIEQRTKAVNEENTLNDFLARLKEFKILEIRDLRKLLDKYREEFFAGNALLREFVDKICRE